MVRKGIFWLFAALATLEIGSAQSFTGSILGTIKDSSDSIVPAATVTVTNVATNARAETKSDPAGNYIAPQLQPGQYRVEFLDSDGKAIQLTQTVGEILRLK